jgi:hypothetical protein
MILRKPFLLRFRGAEQAEEFDALARAAGISLNEWILRKLSGSGVEGHAQSAGLYPHLASRTISTVAKADAEQVSSPASPNKCIQPGHAGFYRSDGYWCATCRKMYVR